MFRLLIVDDVPLIADGLMDMLSRKEELGLELYTAYSAFEALHILSRTKIDIVLTDIQMPVKSGIDLLREIRQQWPRCKVIFLTSYNNFQYAQELISLGGFDYVLKPQGDSRIVTAVKKAQEALLADMRDVQLVERANQQLLMANAALQREYMVEMIDGLREAESSRVRHFEQWHIPLDPKCPVFMLVVRLDGWKAGMNASDRMLLTYAVSNVVNEYLNEGIRSLHIHYDKTRLVWFIQPRQPGEDEQSWQRAYRFVYGTLDTIQHTCKELLQFRVSFLLGSRAVPWEEAAEQFQRMLFMLRRGIGVSEELLMTEDEYIHMESASKLDMNGKWSHFHIGKYSLLYDYLCNGKPEPFFELFEDLLEQNRKEKDDSFNLEICYFLTTIFLSYLNQRNIAAEVGAQFDLSGLYTMNESTLKGFDKYFRGLAELIFDGNWSDNHQRTNRIVTEIQQHIQHHIHDDLSLTRLGEVVHLNPAYLSRLYKLMTGVPLSDYITQMKLERAKQLLRGSHKKIHEIAALLGYNSSIAFIRFFKKLMNTTPQEYRDS